VLFTTPENNKKDTKYSACGNTTPRFTLQSNMV